MGVPPSEKSRFLETFKNNRKFHSILCQTCAKCNFSIEETYKTFGWQIYDDFNYAIEGLSFLNSCPKKFFEKYDVPKEIKKTLQLIVSRRLTKKNRKVRAIFEINCFSFAGVESIKEALKLGEKLSTEELPIKIRLISSPRYSIICLAKDPDLAVEGIENALQTIKKRIQELKGNLVVTESANLQEEKDNSDDYDDNSQDN